MIVIANDPFLVKDRLDEFCRYFGSGKDKITVSFEKWDSRGYAVARSGEGATVRAGRRSDCFAALAELLMRQGDFSVRRDRVFDELGLMADCARNGVLALPALKKLVATLAALGYTYLEIYTEDCMEVPDEPCFGYMRGRYTQAELKELDEYAAGFGIELVPCIQTLAHIGRIFQHYMEYYFAVRDTADILLVGEERTYRLIENVVRAAASAFRSRRINVGMDEAFLLGSGVYLDRNGYEERVSIMTKHLARVLEICKKYGFAPEMWSDMFRTHAFDEKGEIRPDFAGVPEGVRLIHWNYEDGGGKFPQEIARTRKLTPNVSFAGGVWKFVGFAPLNEFSQNNLKCAFAACKEGGIRDFMLTLWSDDGAEASHFSPLPSVIRLACDSLGADDEYLEGACSLLTGYSFGELMALDLPNRLYEGKPKYANPCKYFLYEDAFLGISEVRSRPEWGQKYAEFAERLCSLADRDAPYAYLFRTLGDLCAVLTDKCTLTADVRAAYEKGDRAALKSIAEERLPRILDRLRAFSASYSKQWDSENKPFGYEVVDYRYGGLMKRLTHVRERLLRYLSGEDKVIPELEEKVLPLPPRPDMREECRGYNSFKESVTYCYF